MMLNGIPVIVNDVVESGEALVFTDPASSGGMFIAVHTFEYIRLTHPPLEALDLIMAELVKRTHAKLDLLVRSL